jgi:hypothetical protein
MMGLSRLELLNLLEATLKTAFKTTGCVGLLLLSLFDFEQCF